MLKITLTRRWPAKVEAALSELGDVEINRDDHPFSAQELVASLQSSDVLCATVTDALHADVFNAGNVRTRLIANFGVGYSHIDLSAAKQQGVLISNTPGVLTDATAEIALTLLLSSARRTGEGERLVRAGLWDGWRPTHMLSTQVSGKLLGIVGMGRIGLALARKAHHGLGMRILYCNRTSVAESIELELGAKNCSLEELLKSTDFVSLNCPSTPLTRHLLDAATLKLMQPHAHLINTARGDVIDEAALVSALRDGTIAGAGLDVYAAEPQIERALLGLENVVLLPHMGSGTVETREAMGFCAVKNIRACMQGDTLPDQVVG